MSGLTDKLRGRSGGLVVLVLVLAAGCGDTMTAPGTRGAGSAEIGATAPTPAPTPTPVAGKTEGTGGPATGLTPVALSGGKAELTPGNTSIGFIGAHTDDKPDRVGGFEKFTGTVTVDEAAKTVSGVTVEIDATSIWTQFGNLTNHLNGPDFFDTREHPMAKFESTAVTGGSGGDMTVRGNLTLHGVTQEVEFPAKAMVSEGGVVLTADFTIDRTKFGMDKLTQGVKPEVKVSVRVGQATQPTKAGGA